MKKLSLIKVLGVFSVFYGSSVSFANPVSEVSQAMFSLIGNVNQQHVDTFEGKVQNFIEKLQNGLDTRNKKEKAEVAIAYFMDLIEIAKKVLQYQQNPNQQLRNELEAIARTYGG
ncbi:MAG: hypothetical protein LBJ13_01775, partial [Puniceicoccales bacterium]|nr:hypothetical protein [Puniceicoccales bacterium]